MRKTGMLGGDCGTPAWFFGAAPKIPEFVLSPTKLIVACRPPSTSKDTLPEGGPGFERFYSERDRMWQRRV